MVPKRCGHSAVACRSARDGHRPRRVHHDGWPASPVRIPLSNLRIIFSFLMTITYREALRAKLISSGVIGSGAYVVIAGPANTYGHYITTREEYAIQRYEGASTLYGPSASSHSRLRQARAAADWRVTTQRYSGRIHRQVHKPSNVSESDSDGQAANRRRRTRADKQGYFASRKPADCDLFIHRKLMSRYRPALCRIVHRSGRVSGVSWWT
jgi:hypothetical protein